MNQATLGFGVRKPKPKNLAKDLDRDQAKDKGVRKNNTSAAVSLDQDAEVAEAYARLQESQIAEPVNSRDSKAMRLLKNFDFASEFGPVAGLSRLERWTRAQNMGKNPPAVVHKILTTMQDPEYTQSYLYGHV